MLGGDFVYVQVGTALRKIRKADGKTVWKALEDERAMFGSAFSSPIRATIGGREVELFCQPEILNLLAAAFFNQARYQEAVAYLERAEDLGPSLVGVAANLSVARAARAAEILAAEATVVRAAPPK